MSRPQKFSSDDVTKSLSPTPQTDLTPSSALSHSARRSLLTTLSPQPAPASSLQTTIQSSSAGNLLAPSKKFFRIPKTSERTTSMNSTLTSAQKQRIQKNRQNAVRRAISFSKNDIGLHGMKKLSRTGFNRLPNSLVRNCYMRDKHYCAFLASHKCFLKKQPPTPQNKTDCECRKIALCVSCKN